MERLFPKRLANGDEIRVIAPSRSMAIIPEDIQKVAHQRVNALGLQISFGRHVNEVDDFNSSSIQSRVEDLHRAFADDDVKAIVTLIGGYNTNQLLEYVDWSFIKTHPKLFCGYSDVDALNNALFAKTGLVTFSGPHYSSFGQRLHFEYTLDYFMKCLFSEGFVDVKPSASWSDDDWFKNQEDRELIANNGWLSINQGAATGTILGGNLSTFSLLNGTEFFPDLTDSILFLEDYERQFPEHFDRQLQSLVHQRGFSGVRGIVLGRFQNATGMTNEKLSKIIRSKRQLNKLPILANVDFGHTDPKITYPIGGVCEISVSGDRQAIRILEH